MDILNSSKTRATAVNYASVEITNKLSRIRIHTKIDNYLDIFKKNARCSVHRCLGVIPTIVPVLISTCVYYATEPSTKSLSC